MRKSYLYGSIIVLALISILFRFRHGFFVWLKSFLIGVIGGSYHTMFWGLMGLAFPPVAIVAIVYALWEPGKKRENTRRKYSH